MVLKASAFSLFLSLQKLNEHILIIAIKKIFLFYNVNINISISNILYMALYYQATSIFYFRAEKGKDRVFRTNIFAFK